MEYWERLLVDTESLMDSERRIDFLEETAQLRRAEEATSSLVVRLMGGRGSTVSVYLRSGHTMSITIVDCSSCWLRGEIDNRELIIPLHAISHVKGLAAGRVGDFSGPVSRAMSLASAIRVFADKYREVVICVGTTSMTGKVMRVGSDCVDVMCGGELLLVAFVAIDYISEKRY